MNATEVTREIARLTSAKARVMRELLAHPEGCTNHHLRQVGGSRAMGRVNELIHEGYPITVKHQRGALWLVRLTLSADQAPPSRFVPPAHMPVYTSAPRVTPPRASRTTSVQGELF